MKIRKITKIDPHDQAAIEQTFTTIEPQPIACCNWPQEFPYAPMVQFRIFHTGDYLWLRFEVEELYTKAEVTQDNGRVWTDSCVEFFISLDQSGYYNFETTCIGRLLLAFREQREHPTPASAQVLSSVLRTSSLGTTTFAERKGHNRWSMTLAIPPQALFLHHLTDWSGVEANVNLYKCGDELSHPHFLSWQPIRAEKPDFHLPKFFKHIKFSEKI